MRSLILKMHISVDGFVAGADGAIDWIFKTTDPEGRAWTVETISNAGAHLMGSRTFRDMAAYWPKASDAFAAPMNEIPKVVFSKTLDRGDWPTTTILSGPLEDEVAKLKAEPGGDVIVYGGYTLAQALTRADLVDVYRLVTRPAALGSGEPMFKNLAAERRLELEDVTPYSDGTVITIYRRESR